MMSWSEEDQDSMDNSYDSSTVGMGTNTNQSYGDSGNNYVNSHGIPVTDRSTNFVDFSNDMFGSGMANTWDRLTGNTANRFLNNLDFDNARTFDAFFSGNPLDAMSGPISGNSSVYDPVARRGYEIIDHNKGMDLFGNLINTIANPFPGLIHSFDTARVRDDLTGNVMNFESNQGYLDNSRLVSDGQLAQERLEQQQRMDGQGDQTDSIDNTGGMLATRDENGDIPWWVLANAGLLAV
jgi:hypothetical protein